MKNYKETGERIQYANSSGSTITSGTAVLVGSRLGVATGDIANNTTGILAMNGVFNLPKLSTDVVTQGAKLYWDDTNKRLTLTSTSNTFAGYAHKAAGNGVTTVDIVISMSDAMSATDAASTTIADAGGFTAAGNVEAALAEIYQHLKTAQAFIPISLHSLREATNFDVGNIAANGGLLASDTTPVLSAINDATDGCQRVLWAASNNDQVIAQVPLPPDLDPAADVVVHIRAAMGGTTNTPDITLDSFFNEGDTKVVDTIAAITGTGYAEYTGTIAAADVPAGAQALTIGLTPGAHTTDTLAISAIWIEYKRKVLTA
ncbi:MAG: DUF2190 family protein [Deltaproteobacteria bacterium]|nr:DUF2190 family protein [Deltaproteobacteria bacterium]MCL4873853.1 DUF2190 family protein [bacterium]